MRPNPTSWMAAAVLLPAALGAGGCASSYRAGWPPPSASVQLPPLAPPETEAFRPGPGTVTNVVVLCDPETERRWKKGNAARPVFTAGDKHWAARYRQWEVKWKTIMDQHLQNLLALGPLSTALHPPRAPAEDPAPERPPGALYAHELGCFEQYHKQVRKQTLDAGWMKRRRKRGERPVADVGRALSQAPAYPRVHERDPVATRMGVERVVVVRSVRLVDVGDATRAGLDVMLSVDVYAPKRIGLRPLGSCSSVGRYLVGRRDSPRILGPQVVDENPDYNDAQRKAKKNLFRSGHWSVLGRFLKDEVKAMALRDAVDRLLRSRAFHALLSREP